MADTMVLQGTIAPMAPRQQEQAVPQPIQTPPASTPYQRATAALATGPNPSILVFDCDYTVWPFDCDKNVVAPFMSSPWSGVYDKYGRPSNAYHDVPSIFGAIIDAGIPVAFLSRNPSSDSVRQLLQALPCLNKVGAVEKHLWDSMPSPEYFHAYSSGGIGKGKDRHFAALQSVCGIPFTNMVFFDDMADNIQAAANSGVTSVHLTRNGLTASAFVCGIEGWRKSRVPALSL
jgi:magnesium-dependent phosphatase 1